MAEGERERLTALATRFSREDLMRAFDLLSKAEQEIRNASHPRYYFEMVLLRWMHLRKLVPLAELLEQLGGGGAPCDACTGAQRARTDQQQAARKCTDAPTAAASHRRRSSHRLAPHREAPVAPTEEPASHQPRSQRSHRRSGQPAPSSDSGIARR